MYIYIYMVLTNPTYTRSLLLTIKFIASTCTCSVVYFK